MLEKASKSVWELILDGECLGKEISETVERVFCKLSGQEPPLFPASSSGVQHEKEQEKENPDSGSKKRSFSEMSEGGEPTSNVPSDAPLATEASNQAPSPGLKP